MRPIVLAPQDIAEAGKEFLLNCGYEVRVGTGVDEATICREVADCVAILARNAQITAKVLEAGPKLKVVGRHGVGVDNVDIARATELGIQVTNAPYSNTVTVAEHTIGLIITLAHRILYHDRELRNGHFEIRNRAQGVDVEGKTLGILGLGSIGSLVARKAALGLGMKVIAHVRHKRPVDEWVELVDSADELLQRADFVSLHLPGTPQTQHSIGAREFALMKPTAYLINTGRGEVVDEVALVEALRTKQIAGAGLDVFEQEPPALDNPLFELDNVVVTPHSAALTREAMERMALDAAQGIHDVLSGRKPQWPVNHLELPHAPI